MEAFTAEDMTPQTREDFEFRKRALVEELKDAGIRRELWENILEGAEWISTDAGLDAYMARMQQFNS